MSISSNKEPKALVFLRNIGFNIFRPCFSSFLSFGKAFVIVANLPPPKVKIYNAPKPKPAIISQESPFFIPRAKVHALPATGIGAKSKRQQVNSCAKMIVY